MGGLGKGATDWLKQALNHHIGDDEMDLAEEGDSGWVGSDTDKGCDTDKGQGCWVETSFRACGGTGRGAVTGVSAWLVRVLVASSADLADTILATILRTHQEQ